MKRDDEPTYEELVREILKAAAGPVAVDHLVNEVLARKASVAKNPRRLVRSKLRELVGRVLVFLDVDHVLSVPLAFWGARFRIRLDQESIDKWAVSAESFEDFLPRPFDVEKIQLVDKDGLSIPFQIKTTSHEEKSVFFGKYAVDKKWLVLKEWFRRQKMYHKDHLLVTVEDWEQAIFRLEREAFGEQQPEQLKARDELVANMLYTLLENARSEQIILFDAIPTLYARLTDKAGCPPDHWRYILRHDKRMETNGFDIRYAESRSMMDDLIGNMMQKGTRPKPKPEMKLPKAAREDIYCFRAAFKNEPSIWRDIEIKGGQTLGDLDGELRMSFNHDTYDHLSGFWKLVARGGEKQKRYREVDLGDINPFEGGEAAGVTIASLGLQVKDRLKYVYDFGDWIEHTLTLSAVGVPQPGIKYPREAARNTPTHKFCVNCKEQGKETVATWICLTCSQEQEVVLCEDCINLEEHEDHYTQELVY